MTVKQLSQALVHIKPSLQDKDVKIEYPNGEIHTFDIKFMLKDKFNMDKTDENVLYIILQ